MKILIKNSKIIGEATDDYSGNDDWLPAPIGYTSSLSQYYEVIDNELRLPESFVKDSIIKSTQESLDNFAATRGYDNVNSISKYQNITDDEILALPAEEQPNVTKFRAECRYLALATARTWAKLYLIMDEVIAGTRPMPSGYSDISEELPVLEWPV